MASKQLFSNKTSGKMVPPADTVNLAGGKAYKLDDEAALAQYAVTGCLNGTFYASAGFQLEKVLELASKVSPEFLAKVAVYARQSGYMKDMPALLLAILSTRDMALTKRAFPLVVDDAKMVKNFAQIIRSGQVGRKSFGTALKNLIRGWLDSRTEDQLFAAVVGNDPSLADIIKMVHPKPKTAARSALYAYLIGQNESKYDYSLLPERVRAYEAFKKNPAGAPPEVPFQLLTNLGLSKDQYVQVGKNMSFAALRQNLNVLAKNNAFDDTSFTKLVAGKLSDADQIRRAKTLPFQLYSAFRATEGNENVPASIRNALQQATDIALSNVPELSGRTVVAVDNSGSMSAPVTGYRGTATSSISCLDAAALMGTALLRRNPDLVRLMVFNTRVLDAKLNPLDSLATNTANIRKFPGGGTDLSCVLRQLNSEQYKADLVVYLSDNESWMQGASSNPYYSTALNGTGTAQEWAKFKTRNPNAKLVLVDITPNATTQVKDADTILNVGGFSDSVFSIVSAFEKNELTASKFVDTIKEVKL